uniref:Glutamyl-tRNA(Gln) amidotransferase subunit C, mitochondrial n=1 Tax=Ceratitis capitata TaxID=7213 RepID=W8BQQ0_CERCA
MTTFEMLRFLRNTRLYCTSVSGTNRTKPVTTKESKLNFKKLKYPTKVPINPVLQNFPIVDKSVIDNPTIQLLERLALVNLENKEALSTLESSIEFAEKITLIETTNVLPFYTVLEDQTLYLREDSVTEGNSRENILRGAKVTEEDYFVSPPGNIPLQQKDKDFSENSTECKENA